MLIRGPKFISINPIPNSDDNFENAVNLVLSQEGGYSNNPSDPGGATNFGISQRSYPDLDIANLTQDEAKSIYKRDFWDSQNYQNINGKDLSAKIFSLAVNMGPSRANLLMQQALRAVGQNVQQDGVLGPLTLGAISSVDPGNLLAALKSEAAGYYRMLVAKNSQRKQFLNGWLNRAYS
jgi:lysozyme family protein